MVNTIKIQNSRDFKKLELEKLPLDQVFSYNCESCGKSYERKLYRLQQFNFELLCSKCSLKKHRKPWSEKKKKAALEKMKHTMLERYGVEHALQSREIREKVKKTNLSKYGVENPSQFEEFQKRKKQTNLAKFGVEHPLQSEEIKEKIKQTFLEKYGVECAFQSEKVKEKIKQTNLKRYGVAHPLQSEEVKERIRQINLERYGVEYPLQSEKIQEKKKQTNLERYGVEYPSQSEKVKERIRQTNLAKQGVDNPRKSEEVKKKIKQTNLAKYGVEYYTQSKEMQSKRKQAYSYDNVSFDSKPELAFYVYCKDRGAEIERNNQKFFYESNGKKHVYFPDFVVDGVFYEIKGDQFLNETTNSWQNPFDHSQDASYEAKHQCAIQNNVRILYSEDYQKCIDYVLEKHGKDFFEKCKSIYRTLRDLSKISNSCRSAL